MLIFIYCMLGEFSMWLISLAWADKIRTIGILGAGAGGIVLVIWLFVPGIGGRKKQDRMSPR